MPPDFEERRDALVGLIYDAVLDGSLWGAALEGIADITHSAAALIHGYHVDRELYTFHELARIASGATNFIMWPIPGCGRAVFRQAGWCNPTT
ncbi:hypothetical protein [Bradyrhizobium cosmicum]|uniref:hypothetical protein n=1 Tax=Bradyrhizobium cosmicum TaxID=1404864 RepID=UPI0028E788B5|nr:hypothetical protein [Bradyrhizobium cosmicum]